LVAPQNVFSLQQETSTMSMDAHDFLNLLNMHTDALYDGGIDYDTHGIINKIIWDRISAAGLSSEVCALWRG
jgi:hypothetical protein